jgi:hypothetical protein
MRKYTYYIVALLLLVACSKHKIIPDDKLAMIFHDAYLTNAYAQQQSISLDSVKLYEPIFAKYGYTASDVQYTIGNFSKRKSARLGDVVERAITLLESEASQLDREVAILDTINNIARRTCTRTLYSDTVIRITRLRDTVLSHFTFDDIRPGDYCISFNYLVDSLDENIQLRSAVWFEGKDGRRLNMAPTFMTKRRESDYRKEVHADTSARRLVVKLVQLRDTKPKQPHVTLRNIKVQYTPPTLQAVDSLYLQQLNIRIFAHEFCNALSATKNSSPLRTDTLGTATASSADSR